MGVGGQGHDPAALPPRMTRYPLYRMLGGTQGQSGKVQKILPPPVFDPQTVQPAASCYTDYVIPGHIQQKVKPHATWLANTLKEDIPDHET
jgi:hypothetical protein